MPTYDYVCSDCGHEMEVMHSIHGHGPATCPKCGGHMKKAFSPPTVHYKGTGWARKERSGGARSDRAPAAARSDAHSPEGSESKKSDSSVSSDTPAASDPPSSSTSQGSD